MLKVNVLDLFDEGLRHFLDPCGHREVILIGHLHNGQLHFLDFVIKATEVVNILLHCLKFRSHCVQLFVEVGRIIPLEPLVHKYFIFLHNIINN